MLKPLVEIESRLLPVLQVEPVVESVDARPSRSPSLARPRVDLRGQALELPDIRIVAENDFLRPGEAREQVADRRTPLFHGEGLELDDQRVAKLVHHDARKIIRF